MPDATPTQRAATHPQGGCQGTTKAGAPCQGITQNDRPWCLVHDPERAADARAAQASGATATNKLRSLQGQRAKLASVPELVAFTGQLIQDTLSGHTPPDVARCVLYGVSIQKGLLEASDFEARLAKLEAAQTTTPKGARTWQR